MALVEVRHKDAMAFWYRAVDADELAVLAHRVYLMQSELVLTNHVTLEDTVCTRSFQHKILYR